MDYRGPVSLGASKYASPNHASPQRRFAAFPSAASPVAKSNNAIATKEQIDAAAKVDSDRNSDAQLAIAQNEALTEAVEKHSAEFSKTVSSAVENTRQLLNLIRESYEREGTPNHPNLKIVEKLWAELEVLFEAAKKAKAALPAFLDKQKDNMDLFHDSMLNETIRDSQEELNLQNKKVNLQHSLILEHQEAFQAYKATVAGKLNKLDDIRERASRLTLDKDLLQTEIDNHREELEKARMAKSEDAKVLEGLREELSALSKSKAGLTAEHDTLRNTVEELQEKYTKEVQKVTNLESWIKTLQSGEKDTQKLKGEMYTLQEKYKNQSVEYSKAFTVSGSRRFSVATVALTHKQDHQTQAKKVSTLTSTLQRAEQQNDEIKERLRKLDELEKANAELTSSKSSLQTQIDALKREANEATQRAEKIQKDLEAAVEKLKKVERENDDLETENNELLAKANEHKKITAALNDLKIENSKLLATTAQLQNKPAGDSGGDRVILSAMQKDKERLEKKLAEAEAKKATAETTLNEWAELAKRSYKEYKDMLPTWKQADKYRQDSLDKDNEIAELKAKLTVGVRSNGVSKGGDAAYWKNKYESLLANVGN
ncbi:hypothetical protein BDV95DRAFT_502337 [Massariosphaeria phaeospora]|uniref:Uncharacterized protein n=1 Tax=Massariosphaeria phaeospora TaxID=100035 RepID=A0A7C8I5F4_9PLEO|nr:hypothetical protein BDV95DRAFT_502337 [Massariosphaeria phaeospora]